MPAWPVLDQVQRGTPIRFRSSQRGVSDAARGAPNSAAVNDNKGRGPTGTRGRGGGKYGGTDSADGDEAPTICRPGQFVSFQ